MEIGRKLLMSFLHKHNIKKCQDRLGTPSKLKFLDSLQHVFWIYYEIQDWRGDNALALLKKGLAAFKTRNNADQNDQTSSTTRDTKNNSIWLQNRLPKKKLYGQYGVA